MKKGNGYKAVVAVAVVGIIIAAAILIPGVTWLKRSATSGYAKNIDAWIEKGVRLDAEDNFGKTALMMAVEAENTELVLVLLKADADINHINRYGNTALRTAVMQGNVKLVYQLIKASAKVNNGRSALLTAVSSEDLPIIDLLIDNNANLDVIEGNDTLLSAAVKTGNEEVVSRLLNAGARIDMTDPYGQTALHVASEFGHLPIVNLLIENDANLDATDSNGITPLMAAVSRKNTAIASALIKAGADISPRSPGGTALLIAAQLEHLPTVKLLVEAGSELDIKNDEVTSVLIWAVKKGHTKLLTTLLYAGANTNRYLYQMADCRVKKVMIQDCLTSSIIKGNTENIKFFLNEGADVTVRDTFGRIPLKLALEQGKGEVRHIVVQSYFFEELKHGKVANKEWLDWDGDAREFGFPENITAMKH
ncbi:hypothetical protein C4569_02195 [Candidatus Parcubacteria bacterium]|nr:MAG: hypothetical protein C4569_02195 [Candidatus Parcubacteria bacterium]